jgi:cell division protein FtsL
MLYVAAAFLLIIGGLLGIVMSERRLAKEYDQLVAEWRNVQVEKSHWEKMTRMLLQTSQVRTDIRLLRRHDPRYFAPNIKSVAGD